MKLIICNLKAYLNKDEIDYYLEKIKSFDLSNVVICPSYVYISNFLEKGITIGSQDVSIYKNGNHTGEITSMQLKSLGVSYTLVGHSERCENSDIISHKINNLLEDGIVPILCIGEDLEDKKNNIYKEKINNKIKDILNNIEIQDISKIIIAYEPIWAIGNGSLPTNDKIKEIVTSIKKEIKKAYNIDIKVLYGGSVCSANIDLLNKIGSLDGYLIGKASIEARELENIIKKAKITKKDKN